MTPQLVKSGIVRFRLLVICAVIISIVAAFLGYRYWRNHEIVFVGTEFGRSIGFYRMNLLGGLPKLIASGEIYSPEWSPDGRQIAYVSPAGEHGSPPYHIASMNANGSDIRLLTEGETRDSEPEWSPDGEQLAYVHALDYPSGGPLAIFMMNSDGSGKEQITPYAYYNYLSWSPDGKSIAYYTFVPDGIFFLDMEDFHTDHITDGWTDSFPVWSPDGQFIAFQSVRDDPGEHFDIYVMRPDGSDIHRLTTDPAHDRHPSWSPDGEQIVFESNRGLEDSGYHIYVMNADGSGQKRVTENAGHSPDWRP